MAFENKKVIEAVIERIERLQRELVAMRNYTQGYLDRRARAGITTARNGGTGDYGTIMDMERGYLQED